MQDASRSHVSKVERLNQILDEIERNPTVIDDDKFEEQLRTVQDDVDDLLDRAKLGTGGDGQSIMEKLDDIKDRQKEISRTLSEIEENIYLARDSGMLL